MNELSSNEAALSAAVIEIKLTINRKLYEKGIITEAMYNKALNIIMKESA